MITVYVLQFDMLVALPRLSLELEPLLPYDRLDPLHPARSRHPLPLGIGQETDHGLREQIVGIIGVTTETLGIPEEL